MYIWMVKHKEKYRIYSPSCETLTEAYSWYNRKGKNLEKMFNRSLVLRTTGDSEID